ncbi:MAG: 4-hydroxy-3-methylbut-2-enyl diphosphate reductase [Thermoanaerobaculaceae bacterium]|nr:4-hydroxy-3-methylbut-2-enyl diphosphate reductase [Thermoanaerobaculaceae bacterium]
MVKVIRARKYGFCSGVRTAILKAKKFASQNKEGAILGQIVHNEWVVEEMERLGLKTVETLSEVRKPYIIFSAHGVPPSFYKEAEREKLQVVDATCKFVLDIHKESMKALSEGKHLVFIGDPNHREVIGYTHDLKKEQFHIIQNVEQAKKVRWEKYPAITIFYQTTLNADEYEDVVSFIMSKNRNTKKTDTICYATKENQNAAKELAQNPDVEIIFVIGGKKSANTRHLYEICNALKKSYLIQGKEDIKKEWLVGIKGVGLTAGASTPDKIVDDVEEYIKRITSE